MSVRGVAAGKCACLCRRPVGREVQRRAEVGTGGVQHPYPELVVVLQLVQRLPERDVGRRVEAVARFGAVDADEQDAAVAALHQDCRFHVHVPPTLMTNEEGPDRQSGGVDPGRSRLSA